MPATRVGSRWIGGNLVFYRTDTGVAIVTIDGVNGRLTIPAASLPDGSISGTKLTDATVTAAKLANGAGLAALIASGLGATATYDKTTAGAQDLAIASASARACICVVIVTEAFADNAGAQTAFTIGDESTADSIMTAAKLVGATAGSVFTFAGQITAAEKLVVTGTAALVDGTGAISVTALLLDE